MTPFTSNNTRSPMYDHIRLVTLLLFVCLILHTPYSALPAQAQPETLTIAAANSV